MNINLTSQELETLRAAMDRVSNEISLHIGTTSTTRGDQLVEDITLIIAELSIILKRHTNSVSK
jgi:hypothetical protein